MTCVCPHCGNDFTSTTGKVNAAKKNGLRIFCSRICSGLARRIHRPYEQKKSDKAAYDAEYRKRNEEKIKEFKRQAFQKDYAANPEKYKEVRRLRKQEHANYCRSDRYRKYKKQYDQKYRTEQQYGEFAEAALILFEIEKLVDNRLAKQDMGLVNKTQKRKKLCKSRNYPQ